MVCGTLQVSHRQAKEWACNALKKFLKLVPLAWAPLEKHHPERAALLSALDAPTPFLVQWETGD